MHETTSESAFMQHSDYERRKFENSRFDTLFSFWSTLMNPDFGIDAGCVLYSLTDICAQHQSKTSPQKSNRANTACRTCSFVSQPTVPGLWGTESCKLAFQKWSLIPLGSSLSWSSGRFRQRPFQEIPHEALATPWAFSSKTDQISIMTTLNFLAVCLISVNPPLPKTSKALPSWIRTLSSFSGVSRLTPSFYVNPMLRKSLDSRNESLLLPVHP